MFNFNKKSKTCKINLNRLLFYSLKFLFIDLNWSNSREVFLFFFVYTKFIEMNTSFCKLNCIPMIMNSTICGRFNTISNVRECLGRAHISTFESIWASPTRYYFIAGNLFSTSLHIAHSIVNQHRFAPLRHAVHRYQSIFVWEMISNKKKCII